jgi:fructose transport system permease protein
VTQNISPPTSALDLAAEFLDRRTPVDRLRGLLHRYPVISPAVVLVLAVIVFGSINPRFFAPANLSLVLDQVSVVGTVAVAQTLIILTAGIDLSVGAAMILASMVAAQTAADAGLPAPVALLAGLIVALAAGAINGLLVTRLKLPPFIATLGTFNAFLALSLLYSGGQTVRRTDMPELMTWTATAIPVGDVRLTVGVIIMLALYAAVAFILGRTAWGRHVYAVGDDAEAARLAGISTSRVLMSVYVAAGAVLAIAAWIQIGRSGAASPNAGADLNLDSITAVVIGGTSLFGGRGVIWGSLLGAIIVGVFRNGLFLAGVDGLYQTLAIGILVIVAVSVDQWIRKVRK